MTERELLYVKTIADERSISKAAKKLFLTQPSLSNCIQKLEANLATKLFTRMSTGLTLTFAGERYYQIATNILKIYSDFEIEISDINNLKKGRITIGITVYLATYILPVILPAFKQECPHIEIHIVEKNSTELDKALTAGEIDFAIMHVLPFLQNSNNLKFVFYPLFKDPLLLATCKDHPLKKFAVPVENIEYPKIDITLFAEEPFILLNKGQKIRQVSDLILDKANIDPHIVLTSKSYETARRLAGVGIGVTFVPMQYLKIFQEDYFPEYYYIDEKYAAYWTMGILVPKNAYVSKAACLFIEMVTEQFKIHNVDFE
ncbi:MAG: transcriptional regulator, LysR family [Massilibacillus sp.]|jgi:DNA-binding transcriptional LysR family regulator|nr:transcriptional regulator, LysR family [Massilibacillus sp.]